MNNNNKKINNINARINGLQKQLTALKNNKKQGAKKANVANLSSSSSAKQRGVKTHIVTQTERIGTIVASGTPDFSVVSISINPGISFPWLATQAKLYDKYKFKKLTFRFKTSGPTINFGSVGLGFDYNPLSGNPVSSEEFSQLTKWKLQSAWENFSIDIDVSNTMIPYLYTRSSLVGGADLKTYDLGRLYMVCEGIPATVTSGTVLGYVEADYTVHLINKQPASISQILTSTTMSYTRYIFTNYLGSNAVSGTNHYVCLAPDTWDVNNLDFRTIVGNYNSRMGSTLSTTVLANSISFDPGMYFISLTTDFSSSNFEQLEVVDSGGNVLLSSETRTISGLIQVREESPLFINIKSSTSESINITKYVLQNIGITRL